LSEIRAEMEAALEAASGDSASPAIESTPEVVSAPADSPPVADSIDAAPLPSDTGAAPTETPRGPIPFDRHQAVLTNVRNEYKWLSDYGGAEQARQRLAVTQWLERDPAGFMRTYAASQNIDLRSLLPQEPAPQPKAEEPPQPDILLENGQMTYSTERMRELLAFERRQVSQQFEAELAPIKQERAIAEITQQSSHRAKRDFDHAVAHWAGFQDAKKDIGAYLQANPTATLRDAYIAVVPARLSEQAKQAETQGYQKALTEFQTKAGAAGHLTPRTGGSVAPPRPSSIREALEQAANG
jgi:hypothetical protein